MRVRYGTPFLLYTVQDPRSGKRQQLQSEKKARQLVQEIAERTGTATEDIFWRSDVYYVREYVRGRRGGRRVSTGCTVKSLATEWTKRRERESLGPLAPSQKPLADAIDGWLEHVEAGGRSAATLKDYRSLAGAWRKGFGPVSMESITREDVERFLKTRSKITTKKGERKTAPRTLNKHLVVLRSFFTWGRRRGYADLDPTDGIDHRTEPRREPRVLNETEVRELLRCCREPYTIEGLCGKRNVGGRAGGASRETAEKWSQDFYPPPSLYPAVVVALTSLLRLGNVIGLRWSDIDFEREEIQIPPERVKTRTELVLPLGRSAKRAILDLPKRAQDDLVFGVAEIRSSFRSAVKRAKLKRVSFHALRRTGATFLLQHGVPFEVVKKLGGWSTGKDVLLTHYRVVGMEELRKAVAVLDGLVSGETGAVEVTQAVS